MDETEKLSPLIWIDHVGRRWSTRLEIPEARRLRDCGYDVRDHHRIEKLLADPWDFADFAVEYLRPQWATHADVIADDVAFLVVLTATETSLAECHAAIVAGLVDFFRRCGDAQRAALIERVAAAIAAGTEALLAKINGPKVDETLARHYAALGDEIDRQLDATSPNFGAIFGKSAAKSESPPTG
jgi:hypothetical protein